MGLWMLSFGDHGAAIIEAESMAHARLRVAVKGLVRASSFIGGFQINPEFIPLIPDESIGQKLSREHASELLEMLKNGLPWRSAKLSHLGPPVPTLALPGLLAPPAKAAPPDFREESRENGAHFEGRRLILAWPTPAEPSRSTGTKDP